MSLYTGQEPVQSEHPIPQWHVASSLQQRCGQLGRTALLSLTALILVQ